MATHSNFPTVVLIGTSSRIDAGSGINAVVKEYSLAFKRAGVQVKIAGQMPEDTAWLESNEIELFVTDQNDEPFEACRKLLAWINQSKITAILNNDNPFVQSIAPVTDCVFVSICHMHKTSIETLACFNHKFIDHIIAISGDMVDRLSKERNIPRPKITLVYNGVNLEILERRKTLNVAAGRPLQLVFAGGQSARKNWKEILHLSNLIDQEGINAHIHWYGNCPPSVKAQLDALPITAHGRVPRDQFIREIRECDVLLFPSKIEGCPMAVVESMALGLVPIVSDGIGAMSEIVTHGVDGYVCRLACWPQDAIACLSYLANHQGRLEVLRAESEKTTHLRFSAALSAQHVLKLLREPAIDRSFEPMMSVKILRWHRPTARGRGSVSLVDRVAYRAGFLRVALECSASELTIDLADD